MIKPLLKFAIILSLLAPTIAIAQVSTQGGGTGTTSPSGILFGDGTLHLKTVTIGSNLTFLGGILSAIGGAAASGVATTSLLATYPITVTKTTASITFGWGGLSTTSPFSTNQFVYTNSSGSLVTAASSSLSLPNAALQNSSITVNGTIFNLGDTHTITAASSTLLANNNTFSGTNIFNSTITGSVSGNAGTATALQTGRTIAITGDLAYTSASFDGSGNVTGAGTLATVNSNVGSFTNANITVNGKGLITAASNGTGGSGTGLSTTSPIAAGNLLEYSSAGAGSAFGVATSTLSASGPLTGSFTQVGSGGSLGCTTASAGVAGCLNSSDWSTFNNKQAALTFTYPLVNTANTITGFGTTTTWGMGNNGFVITGATGIPFTAASSSLNLPNTALQNSSITLNGSAVSLGGSATISSTTLLANNNTFSGINLFTNASSDFSGTWQTFLPSHFQTALGFTAVPTTRAINTTYPLQGGGDLSADRTITFAGLSTTSPWTQSSLAYVVNGNTVASVATGTISAGSSAITVTAGRAAIGGALAIDCATSGSGQNGCLSSTDWSTFNNKQPAGGYFTSYDAFTHPQVGTSATTSGMIFTAASSTFTGNLSITGNSTTTNATTSALAIKNITGCNTTSALTTNATGGVVCGAISGSGTTPGGATTDVQFNDTGSFGGQPSLQYDKTLSTLLIGNSSGLLDDSNLFSNANCGNLAGCAIGGIVFPTRTNGGSGGTSGIQVFNATTSGETGNEIDVFAGFGSTTGNGGGLFLQAGDGGLTSGTGGRVNLTSGAGNGAGDGGGINIKTGRSNGSGVGGDITLSTGTGGHLLFANGGFAAVLNTLGQTAQHTFATPDEDGTITLGTGFTTGDCIKASDSLTVTDSGAPCGSSSGGGLATSSPISTGNLLEYSSAGAGSAFGVATGTVSAGSGISLDNSTRSVIGGSLAISVSGLTTSNFTSANISQWTNNSNYITLGSLSATTPIIYNNSTGAFTWVGLATTSQPSSSNLLTSNGTAGVYGTATSTLTASGPLTGSFTQVGSGGSLGCTTASSGVGGCLSNTAFDTFNGKQAALSIPTWPIQLSGTTLSFGWATTSQPSSSNLFVSNGTNGFYGVATGTVSAGSSAITVTANRAAIGGALAIDCATASGSQAGCLSSADWTTFNGKLSGNQSITLSGVVTGSGATAITTAFGSQSAGVLGNPATGNTAVQATSTLYGAVQNGKLLGGVNGTLQYVATTTAGTGLTYNAGTPGSFSVNTTQSISALSNLSTNALVVTGGGNGTLAAYGGASACSSNNFVTTISALGATTCGTASISGVNLGSNLNSLSTNSSLTGTSYNGSATVSNWGINLANSNTWTAGQTFNGQINLFTASNALVGIGTTSPFASLSIATTSANALVVSDGFNTPAFQINTSSTTGSIFTVEATTTSNAQFFGGTGIKLFDIDQYGHETASSTGATPTLSSCGSSPTITAGSNDVTGDVVMGTGSPTACTVTFAHAYATTPEVIMTEYSSTVTAYVSARSTTAFTVTLSAGLSSDAFGYYVIQP